MFKTITQYRNCASVIRSYVRYLFYQYDAAPHYSAKQLVFGHEP